ncbi:MAG: hypothetical protein JNM94_09320 [Phycisphaerae bacterium]|nr:hypothetical protein [Phycisphaerae bacterium]
MAENDANPSGSAKRYWFAAKRYGWGWGLPCAWQGWVVLLGYVALLVAGVPFVSTGVDVILYLTYVLVLSAILVAICWKTGEPARWRWGDGE